MSETTTQAPTTDVVREENQAIVYRQPEYTVRTGDSDYKVAIDLPGVRKENISLNVEDDILTVVATREAPQAEGWTQIHREIKKSSYKLQLKLNSEVNTSGINASYADGVLSIRIPKAEKAKARVISVE